VPAGSNGSTEASRNLVVTKIDVSTAARAICRCRSVADFMFALALKTGDDPAALPFPDTLKAAMNRNFAGLRCLLFWFELGLRNGRRERTTALPANGGLDRRIF